MESHAQLRISCENPNRGVNLPNTPALFYEQLDNFLNTFYDLKHIMNFCDGVDNSGIAINNAVEDFFQLEEKPVVTTESDTVRWTFDSVVTAAVSSS